MKPKNVLSNTENINNIINIPRHNPPAVREWSDSIYSYNDINVQESLQNSKSLKSLLSIYLHLVPKSMIKGSFVRFRKGGELFRKANPLRKKGKQIFLSSPFIKQTSDKINVTIFTFDREKRINNKKLFIFNRELKNSTQILLNKTVKPTKSFKLSKKLRNRKISTKYLANKFNTNYSSIYNNIYLSMLSLKNRVYNIYMYGFLKWFLSAFNYNTLLIKKGDKLYTYSRNYDKTSFKILNSVSFMMLIFKGASYQKLHANGKTITCINLDNIIQTLYLNDKVQINVPEHSISGVSNTHLRYVNNVLVTLLVLVLGKKLNKKNISTKISEMLVYYNSRYISMYVNKYLTKHKLVLKNLYKLYANKVKHNNLVSGVKLLISNIYNKKVELNIVNLKYLHLNSDLLINAIAVKLRNKKSKLLKVFRRALKLVKVPYLVYNTKLFVDLNNSNLYKSRNVTHLSNNTNIDSMHFMLDKIYPHKAVNFLYDTVYSEWSSIKNVLNAIQYKWTTGVRIEGKGRLTKRFIASRAVFKYRYKGSLTNLEYLNMPGHRKESTNIVMLRNQDKPNVQYSFASNRRNIGVYGIKGWISNK